VIGTIIVIVVAVAVVAVVAGVVASSRGRKTGSPEHDESPEDTA
jgi:hypothetical protein